jgi:hypothetical protein
MSSLFKFKYSHEGVDAPTRYLRVNFERDTRIGQAKERFPLARKLLKPLFKREITEIILS